MTENVDLNSRAWRLVSHDPVTSTRVWELDIDEKNTVVRTEYYAENELLEMNKAVANENDGKRWGDGQIVASIPLNVYFRQFAPAVREGDSKHVRKLLNDSDLSHFRTKRGQV